MLHNLLNIADCSDEGEANTEEQEEDREGELRKDNNLHNKEVNTARQTQNKSEWFILANKVQFNDELFDTYLTW